jgi:hypothetical protein
VRKLRFLAAAIAEVAAAAQFYDEQHEHLGKRFVCAVEEGAERIKVDPFSLPCRRGRDEAMLDSDLSFLYSFPRYREKCRNRGRNAPAQKARLLEETD